MSISLVTDSNGVTWVCFDEPTAPAPAPKPKERKPVYSFELKIRVGHDGPGEDNWYYELDDAGADRFIIDFTQALADYAWVDCEVTARKRNDPNYVEWFALDDTLPRKRATKRMNALHQRMLDLALPMIKEPRE